MTRRLRLILSLRLFTLVGGLIAIVPLFMAYLWGILGLDNSDSQYFAAILAPIFTAFLYGIYRVMKSHPYAMPRYRDWLASTPWSYGKPLPLGPVRIVWEDFLILTCLASIAVIAHTHVSQAVLVRQAIFPENLYDLIGVIVFAFFLGRTLCLAGTIAENNYYIAPVFFLAPLIIYPHFNLWMGMISLLLIYLIVAIGVRWTLSRFPWELPRWKQSTRELLLQDTFKQGLIGWPYRDIGPPRKDIDTLDLRAAVTLSALAAWWTFSFIHGGVVFAELSTGFSWQELISAISETPVNNIHYNGVFWLAWWVVVVVIAAGRTIAYMLGTWPPISLLGRIATGRLIIPGYDKIFVAPIILLAYGWAGPSALFATGLSPLAIPAVSLFGLLMLGMTLGPSREAWYFTGHHRVRSWGPPTNSNRNRTQSRASPRINLTGPSR